MDYDSLRLYYKLEELRETNSLNQENLDDEKVKKYHLILMGLPELLSFNDLVGYHNFLMSEDSSNLTELTEENEELVRDRKFN